MELLEPLGFRDSLDQLDRPDHKVREATLDHKDKAGRQVVLVRKGPLDLRDKEERRVFGTFHLYHLYDANYLYSLIACT